MELNKRGANPNTDNSSFEIIIIIKKMFRGGAIPTANISGDLWTN